MAYRVADVKGCRGWQLSPQSKPIVEHSGVMSFPAFFAFFPAFASMWHPCPCLGVLQEGVAKTCYTDSIFLFDSLIPSRALFHYLLPSSMTWSFRALRPSPVVPPPHLSSLHLSFSLLRVGGSCKTERLRPFMLRELSQARRGRHRRRSGTGRNKGPFPRCHVMF